MLENPNSSNLKQLFYNSMRVFFKFLKEHLFNCTDSVLMVNSD